MAGKVPTPLRDKSNQGQNPDRVHPSKAWRRGRVCPTVPANSFIAVSMFCVCVLCLCFVFCVCVGVCVGVGVQFCRQSM